MSEYKHKVKTTCKFCRNEFDSFGLSKICPNCEKNMEKYYHTIREYIKQFPNASVSEICDALDIPSALIKYFLKEERLEIKKNSNNYFLRCEQCNKPIYSGRYCQECEIKVARLDMQATLTTNPENEKMERTIAGFHSRMLLKRK